jgi:alanine racemase
LPEGLDQLRAGWARVDLTRLAENYRAVTARVSVPLMPVVKADAYGHGAARVTRWLEALGAPLFAVAYPEEGVALRKAGVRAPIVVMAGFGPGQEALLAPHDLTAVVSTAQTLTGVMAAARDLARPLSVHVKVDTGMTRLGFLPGELAAVVERLLGTGRIEIMGLMTHLATADEDADFAREQLDRFDETILDLARRGVRPKWIHAASSAGLCYLRPTHTLARPGLLLYGLRPRPLAPDIAVQPVMSLRAGISALKEIDVGTTVSYGRRWLATRRSRIATLPLGYADGVPRTQAMEQRGQLSIRGRRVPVAGPVCMDLTMLDVTDHPDVADGDEAIVFGEDPTAWEVADWAGTTVWQVLTGVGPRVPRVYVENGALVGIESPYLGR